MRQMEWPEVRLAAKDATGNVLWYSADSVAAAWVDARYANHPAKIPVSPVSHPASRQRKTLPAMVPSRWAKLPAILLK